MTTAHLGWPRFPQIGHQRRSSSLGLLRENPHYFLCFEMPKPVSQHLNEKLLHGLVFLDCIRPQAVTQFWRKSHLVFPWSLTWESLRHGTLLNAAVSWTPCNEKQMFWGNVSLVTEVKRLPLMTEKWEEERSLSLVWSPLMSSWMTGLG